MTTEGKERGAMKRRHGSSLLVAAFALGFAAHAVKLPPLVG